jgi:hypothetical protein
MFIVKCLSFIVVEPHFQVSLNFITFDISILLMTHESYLLISVFSVICKNLKIPKNMTFFVGDIVIVTYNRTLRCHVSWMLCADGLLHIWKPKPIRPKSKGILILLLNIDYSL